MTVGKAAPLTFICKTKINRGSKIIFKIAPIKTVIIPTFAKSLTINKTIHPRLTKTKIVPIK